MNQSILDSEKQHLAELLEAIQRCVYFLFNSIQSLIPLLFISAVRFLNYCQETLDIEPKEADFSPGIHVIVKQTHESVESPK